MDGLEELSKKFEAGPRRFLAGSGLFGTVGGAASGFRPARSSDFPATGRFLEEDERFEASEGKRARVFQAVRKASDIREKKRN